jgi:amino acid transporter
MPQPPTPQARLRADSIGLPQALFQALTHMGPAAAVASSLLVAVSFAGADVPLAVLLSLVVILLIAVAVGEFAKNLSTAGGLADYVSAGLGRRAGYFVGWLYAPLELLIAPVVFMFFGSFLSDTLRTSAGISIPWWIFAIAAAALVCFLNVRDVRISTNVGVILGCAELLIFLVFSLYLILRNPSSNTIQVFNPASAPTPGLSGIFKGVVFTIFAFQGFETAAPLAEETRNPLRTIPRTIFLSALGCGIFYFICSYAGVIGWGFNKMGTFASAGSPWITLAHKFWGMGWLLILLALINSFLGNANAGSSAASRILFAFGRNGTLPRVFSKTHPVHHTPNFAIYFQTALTVIVSLGLGIIFGPVPGFTFLGAIITVFAVLIYMLTCAACIRYYLTVRRSEFNLLKHFVAPILAIAILFAPLYFQFSPWPAYPGNWGDIASLVFVGVAAVAAVFFVRRPTDRPDTNRNDAISAGVQAGRGTEDV